ncbi:MAG: hypothetical protein J7515_12885 [Caulobacter sp.]|nr:hypothetical protein [Caulobacter sp.]
MTAIDALRERGGKLAAKIGASEPNADLVWGLVLGTVVRVLGQANFLSLFYGYGAQGGNPLMKISPGTYIIMIVFCRAWSRKSPPGMETFKLAATLVMTIVVGGVAWALVTGQAVAVGYLVDSYAVAAAGLFILGKVGPEGRTKVYAGLIWALLFNALLLFPEFILKRRFIPAPLEGARGIFRPAALLNHPLMSGLMYATAAPLVMRWRKPFIVKAGVALLFVLCVFFSGARVSTVLAGAAFVPAALIALGQEKPKSSLGQTWLVSQSMLIAALIPIVVIVAFASGALDRIGGGLYDKSAATRVWQFGMIQYLSPHQLIFGIGNTTAADWSVRLFQTPSVESAFVLGVFMYGMPFTIFYLGMVVVIVALMALKGDTLVKLSAVIFLTAAMSNNTLGAKNPAVFYFLMFAGSTMVQSVRRLPKLRMPWMEPQRPPNLMTAQHSRVLGSHTAPDGGPPPSSI